MSSTLGNITPPISPFLPLPATPTLSSPLNHLTLEIVKFDIQTPIQQSKIQKPKQELTYNDLPLTPTLSSPPKTPLIKFNAQLNVTSTPSSPTFFSSPPKTSLLKIQNNNNINDSPLPTTPTLRSPPFTPMIKGYYIDNVTPTRFDCSGLSLPSTPIMESPTTTTLIDVSRFDTPSEVDSSNASLPPLPETPTLHSPTFTPLISIHHMTTPASFHGSPLPATPTFKSPPRTPQSVYSLHYDEEDEADENEDKENYHSNVTPITTPTLRSPLQTPMFNQSFSSPVPSHSYLSPSALDCGRAVWKQ